MASYVDRESEDCRRDEGGGGDGPSEGRSAAPPGEPPNMGESVTPHVGITEGMESGSEWPLLANGVDSLDLSLKVDWGEDWPDLESAIRDGKARAKGANGKAILRDTSQGPCLVHPAGKPPMYAYHLEVKNFHLFVSTSREPTTYPNVFVSFNAKALWSLGVKGVVAAARGLVRELGGSIQDIVPSRVDLCADFLIPDGLKLDLLREAGVTRTMQTSDIMSGATLETFYVGARGAPTTMRIYDKAKETLKHGKAWLKDVWGVETIESVWRVEFQLRRPTLKAYGVDSIDALERLLAGIWVDLTANWYSLRLHDDSNTTRRTVHPFWQVVQAVAPKFGEVVEVKRVLSRCGNAAPEFYESRVANMLVGFAVASGLLDLNDAVQALGDAVLARWTDEEFTEAYQVKSVELNLGPVEEGEGDAIPF